MVPRCKPSWKLTLVLLLACFSTRAEDVPAKLTEKKPAPEAKALQEASASIKDIFKEEYAKNAPVDKEALSIKLAQQATETKDDAPSQYMLWYESAVLSAQIGKINVAMNTLDELNAHYAMDLNAARKAILLVAGTNSKDPEVVKLVTAYRTLLDKPSDGIANSVVGRSLCILEKSWDKAFVHLAKGSDNALKAAAEKELAGASTTEARVDLADMWFEFAEKEAAKLAKAAWYERASIWYNAASADAAGLLKTKVDKRIAACNAAIGEKSTEKSNVTAVKTANPGTATTVSTNAAIQPGSIKNTILTESTAIPFTGVPYRNAGVLQAPLNESNTKRVEINVEAGVEITGGQIQLHRTGKLLLNGTEDRPIILRNVIITQDWGGWAEGSYVIFDNCEFRKVGSFFAFAGFSTRWKFKSSIFYKSGFMKMNQREFGFEFDDCAFIGWTFPDISYDNKDIRDAKSFDHSNYLRKNWNRIHHCLFLECAVSPVIFWISEESNFYSTRFTSGETYNSVAELVVENYVSGAQGELPVKAKDKPIIIKPVQKPFPKLSLPEKCPIPELTPKLKIVYGN